MQQLSLFDFGEEAPKPEKKKKASESDINQPEPASDTDNPSATQAEVQTEVKESAKPASVSSNNEEPAATPAVQQTPTAGEVGLEASDATAASTPENSEENTPENLTEKEETEDKQVLNANAELNLEGDDRQEPLKDGHAVEHTPKETINQTNEEKPVDKIQPQASPALADPGLSSVDIVNSDNKPGEENKVLFSNDQIRIKNIVVKSSKEATASESAQTEATLPSSQQTPTSQPSSSSTIDTSFLPEELSVDEGSTEQYVGEKIQETQPQAQSSLMEGEVVIHSDRNEDAATTNESDDQEQSEKSTPKRPYYIEDQTVPVRKRGRKSFKEIDAEVDLINVPPDEELFQKQYYPISVVAKWFRVNNSLLRFWENEFKILKPRKNKKGDRFFRPEDVKNLQLIYYLLRQKKLTINGAIKHLKSYKEQTEVNMQLIQTLNDFKGFLLELRAATEK